MKRLLIALAAAAALPLAATAQAPDKKHPPEKAMDSATPEMKNPGGTKDLHPPQKAMDEATPTETKPGSASKGASTASAAADFPSWDTRKAGEGMTFSGGAAKPKN